MEPDGRMKPGKTAIIPARQTMHIEWHIINDDMPAPMVHTVGFEGIMTKEVL
jgi:hypothetical protein